MVYINVTEKLTTVILDCYKDSKNGEHFELVIDKSTLELIKRPENSDIDVSVAYSCILKYLKNGKPLPEEEVASWG